MADVYSYPLIYDIAFGDRNVAGECDFLLNVAEIHRGRPVESAIEMACGPGGHFREMSKSGIVSDGMDLAPEMVAYANELVAKEQLTATAYEGDMRQWTAPRKYDLAYCLLVSFAHLLTNADILAHLNCVANLLTPGGVYVISHAHPRDFYGSSEPSVERTWTAERDGVTVETDWGGENQHFDPIAEIDELSICYTVTSEGNSERIEAPVRLRRLSYQTLLALILHSGRFELAATYGDFDIGRRLDSADAVRLVAVLKKI